ncbi:hypothetical protein RI367_004539 [Sorochytrium milnesiophthora]
MQSPRPWSAYFAAFALLALVLTACCSAAPAGRALSAASERRLSSSAIMAAARPFSHAYDPHPQPPADKPKVHRRGLERRQAQQQPLTQQQQQQPQQKQQQQQQPQQKQQQPQQKQQQAQQQKPGAASKSASTTTSGKTSSTTATGAKKAPVKAEKKTIIQTSLGPLAKEDIDAMVNNPKMFNFGHPVMIGGAIGGGFVVVLLFIIGSAISRKRQ